MIPGFHCQNGLELLLWPPRGRINASRGGKIHRSSVLNLSPWNHGRINAAIGLDGCCALPRCGCSTGNIFGKSGRKTATKLELNKPWKMVKKPAKTVRHLSDTKKSGNLKSRCLMQKSGGGFSIANPEVALGYGFH